MKTAVEWFEEQVGHASLMALKEFNEIFEQAKEMEKEQHQETFKQSRTMKEKTIAIIGMTIITIIIIAVMTMIASQVFSGAF